MSPDSTLYLTNHFLIAMPGITDASFSHAVIYLCEHSSTGAIGIIINQPANLTLAEVLQQMDISTAASTPPAIPILNGGPIYPERGFVLHTPNGEWRSSLSVNPMLCVTTSRDILQAIAEHNGPSHALIALGYARWNAGQLEQEIIDNVWLTAPADPTILFDTAYELRWHTAIANLGVDLNKLASFAGHA